MINVIPAIDLMDGKCVRLKQGDFNLSTTYREDPLEVAKEFESLGAKRLHLVDLDGAKNKKVVNYPVLEKICKETNLFVDFGGGIQQDEDVERVFDSGAEMITCGSIAIKQRALFEQWILRFGADKIILAADVKDKKIAVHGWQETSDTNIFSFIEDYMKVGISNVLCTDISRDGMLTGTATDLYVEIMEKFPTLKLIASGGISNAADIKELDEAKIFGVVVGKAIYEGKISQAELKSFF
ncbi:1-(5-phosphoribosyl)-5-[(5-phosphoribosylamino)methylideneamino]imidazole-4-carboxamide isomerase [Chondrinema litorale]|uniref:1-(5-phosphoribosyl)-5-[(5- phosphoribosylamino)methylideneamino]imidazole-4- carboxamide isomerase n=1 Tax=Chondrinema litorale TaxID=2994555 RepID=UPI0025444145|nr:1-(5-phosphoribosyl)-5-[(5-phosphoribosylamino)methylideneamino]imidazole-4-carboxamide isomerase [Chondrinema litorale]UZR93419.1 1-(5-phosphoribosyl)-5-[(5-phosphoribosylamino)methylideneamino]imidazole-4-carboxamide isomerase [Chondrinema litorale]